MTIKKSIYHFWYAIKARFSIADNFLKATFSITSYEIDRLNHTILSKSFKNCIFKF